MELGLCLYFDTHRILKKFEHIIGTSFRSKHFGITWSEINIVIVYYNSFELYSMMKSLQ